MTASRAGLLWCLTFVVLEAVQAVFFGGLFQRHDSFLIGLLVFGLISLAVGGWLAVTAPEQLRRAVAQPRALIGVNVTVALAWVAYLLAVQRIEPAVAFTIFAGAVPLTTLVAARLGVPEAEGLRSRAEGFGNAVLLLGLVILAGATLGGWSGFVRGGLPVALTGVGLAAASGVIITGMLFYCRRLDRAGVGPLAQFGLRFGLYLAIAAAGAALGLDRKGAVPPGELASAVLVGLAVMAVPLYALQKAIALVPPLTIGAFGALGPLLVFLLQALEGRVAYAPATLVGLAVFSLGALLAAGVAATAKPAGDTARGS